MKTRYSIILATAVLTAAGCTEKHETYNLPETRLGFTYTFDESAQQVLDSASRYTFVYKPSDVVEDTIWITMQTSGFVSDKDRHFEIQQVEADATNIHTALPEGTEVINAESGKHFMPFDSPETRELMVVKAGATTARLPIIVYRHPDLLSDKIYLRIRLKENENFKESFLKNRYMVIELSDMLSKPREWGLGAIEYYFTGPYSTAKHRFMIDNATWTLDDKWFATHFSTYNVDMGYTGYLSTFFTNKLIEVNDKRLAEGGDVIRDDKGNPIYFVNFGSPQPYKSN